MNFDPTTARPVDDAGLAFDPSTARPENAPAPLPPAAALKHTYDISPEDAAEVLRLKKRAPAPFDVLYANLKDVKLQEAVAAADERLKTSPKLAEYIGKRPEIAPIVRDDIGTLAQIERFVGEWWDNSVTGFRQADVQLDMAPLLYAKAVGRSLSAAEEARLAALRERAKALQDKPKDAAAFAAQAQGYSARQFMSSVYAQMFGASAGAIAGAAAGSVLPGVGTLAGGGAGAVAGALVGSANYSFELETAFAYDELSRLRDVYGQPIPEDYVRAAAQAVGVINSVIEASSDLALAALFPGVKQVVGQAFGQTTKQVVAQQVRAALADPARRSAMAAGVRAMLGSGAIQGLEEFLQGLVGAGGRELAQALSGQVFAPDSAAADLQSASSDATKAFVGTALTLGVASGASNVVSVVLQNRQNNEVRQTIADSDRLTEAMKLAGSAKARELAPAEFREIMHQAAQGKVVYLDGEVLAQMPQQVLAQLPEQTRQEIGVAAETGAAVKLDVADVLTIAPGTPLEEAVARFGRSSPDAFTRAEVENQELMAARLQQQAETIIAQAQDAEAARQAYDAVRDDYAAQIAATGRYSPAVAEGMANFVASFYTVYAQRAGLTVPEMRIRYPLRVVPEATRRGEAYAAPRPGRLDAVEAYHYSPTDLHLVDTGMYGRGLAGSGREAYLNAADQRLAKRSYFYVDKGTGINPEAGVGGRGHRASLSNVYDADADPLRLKQGRDQLAFESAVLDNGFAGYLSRLEGTQSGQVIMLGPQQIPVEQLGPLARTEAARKIGPPAARESRGRDQVVDRLSANKELPMGQLSRASWEMVLSRRMPAEAEALRAAGVFAEGGPVYKDELIADFIARTPAEKYEQSVSTRVPRAAKGNVGNPLTERLTVGMEALKSAPTAFRDKLASIVSKYDGFRRTRVRNAEKVLEQFIADGVENILWLHDNIPAGLRQRAKLWYDGGRAIIDRWVEKHEGRYTDAQVAGVLAVMSPSMDWFQNVSLAERILEIYDQKRDFRWTVEMDAVAEALPGLKKYEVALDAMRGRTLGEVLSDPDIAAKWIAVYERTYYPTDYRIVTPEGDFGEIMTSASGAPSRISWSNGFPPVAKAVSVLNDGSFENISAQLGMRHKVRSFYNNLFDPADPVGDTTVDTHAVAAALLMPLSQTSPEVLDNFGAAGTHSATGLVGSYALYQEMYSRAAKQRGLLPREMQSIAWEAVRALFTKAAKRGAIDDIRALWRDYANGKGTLDEVHDAIYALAGGFDRFAWEGSDRDGPAARWSSSYAGELLDGGGAERAVAPRVGDAGAGSAEGAPAALADFTAGGLKGLLGKTGWAILTAQNPNAKQVSDVENARAMRRLGEELAAMGAQFTEVEGLYTNPERSYIVTGITEQQAFDLGRRYAQESVLTPRGLVFMRDGSVVPAVGVNVFQSKPENNYTVAPDGTYFSLDLDWGSSTGVFEQPAYHGTPHRGIGRFSLDKIGTGEGAQAYGWGLYFASRKEVAEFYRKKLAATSPAALEAIRSVLGSAATDEAVAGVHRAVSSADRPDAGAAWLKRNYEDLREVDDAVVVAAIEAGRTAGAGQTYVVDIPEAHELLDYDAKLKDQPQGVKAALEALGFPLTQYRVVPKTADKSHPEAAFPTRDAARAYIRRLNLDATIKETVRDATGRELYDELSSRLGGDREASLALRDAGVPGLRYLDASARGPKGDAAHHNYVIFDDARVQITGALYQQPTAPRGTFDPNTLELVLGETADLSTFFHESGHFFLEVLADLATQPGAPQQLVDDFNAILAWFGIEGTEQGAQTPAQVWQRMTLDQKRPHHERWAESIEQYVMEGKVPNKELAPLMRRFAAWLKSVYGSIKQFLASRGVPAATDKKLNDDIRRVMDRMLATDEQIAQAEAAAGMDTNEEATAEAQERLRRRSMRDLRWIVKTRDAVIAKIKKEARKIERETRAAVTAEVESMPEFQAKAALEAAEKAHEDDPVSADFNAAAIADAFGFKSVELMYAAIDRVGDKAELIEARTQQRMLEEHGELTDERAIKDAANEAIHNEARARALATELRTQQEVLDARTDTGRTNARGARITTSVIVEAGKRFAEQILAKVPIDDLRATAWKHTVAERNAAHRWRQATMAGKTEEAIKAKQDQFLNNAAARAATQARSELRDAIEFFRRVLKGNDEKVVEKGRDPALVNAARAILGAYGMQTPTSKRAPQYLDLVSQYDPDTAALLQPIVQAALDQAQPFTALNVEQFRELHALVKQLWSLAKETRQLEVAGKKVQIDDAAGELYARMEELGIPDEMPGDRTAITPAQRRRTWLTQDMPALLRRVEQWAEAKDGGFGGPFLRLLFQPVKEAADRFRAERAKRREQFTKHIERYKDLFEDKTPIEAPEIGYTFGADPHVPAMSELMHALLHTGNTSNKTKLLAGRGWGVYDGQSKTLDSTKWDAFIQRLHDKGVLTQRHWEFVQGVWDLLDELKPAAQETHRRVYGRHFAEVTAEPVVTPFGVFRGGYAPAQIDPRLVKDGELKKNIEVENSSANFIFPTTNKGFTMARVESYTRPLLLDMRTFAMHIDKVLLFTHMQPAVAQTQRLLRHKAVGTPLNKIDGAAINAMLIPWLNRAARQQVETPIIADAGLNRALSLTRARVGAGLMMLNVSNALQQATALSTALVKVGPLRMLRSAAEYMRHPAALSRAVWDKSIAMRDRAKNEVAILSDTMNQILIDPSLRERGEEFVRKHAYVMQTAVDSVTGVITWRAAYNQALEQGMAEEDAIRFADGTVRQTHGTTLPEDISRFESGPAYERLFTQFMSYFNMLANTNATAVINALREGGVAGAGRAAYATLVVTLTPLWVAEAIALAMRGGPDDGDDDGELIDDWLASIFGFGTAKGLTAMVPGLNWLAQPVVGRFTDTPIDDRFSLSPTIGVVERAIVGNTQTVMDALDDDKEVKWQRAIRDGAAALTLLTGLPLLPLARPLGYAAGVAQGTIEPQGPADLARGLVTGTASPESKVP